MLCREVYFVGILNRNTGRVFPKIRFPLAFLDDSIVFDSPRHEILHFPGSHASIQLQKGSFNVPSELKGVNMFPSQGIFKDNGFLDKGGSGGKGRGSGGYDGGGGGGNCGDSENNKLDFSTLIQLITIGLAVMLFGLNIGIYHEILLGSICFILQVVLAFQVGQ